MEQDHAKSRPDISYYNSISEYLSAMLSWRREESPDFSVRAETKKLYKCSPALVTQVLRGQRCLTKDRVDAFSKLLRLTPGEKSHLDSWVTTTELQGETRTESEIKKVSTAPKSRYRRREGENYLLQKWLNVYVREAATVKGFRPEVASISNILGNIASDIQIERSLAFCLREGFLKWTLDQEVVQNEPVVTTTDEIPNAKIREFHKKALGIALDSIDKYPHTERRANAVVISLTDEEAQELKQKISEFYEHILAFSEKKSERGTRLYQILLNFCPMGELDYEKSR
jgi:uncharacterized protein (TIGR02147 family)